MDKISDELAAYICDELCKFPDQFCDQEELEEKCSGCRVFKLISEDEKSLSFQEGGC